MKRRMTAAQMPQPENEPGPTPGEAQTPSVPPVADSAPADESQKGDGSVRQEGADAHYVPRRKRVDNGDRLRGHQIRASDVQWQTWKRAAEALDLSMSQWIRKSLDCASLRSLREPRRPAPLPGFLAPAAGANVAQQDIQQDPTPRHNVELVEAAACVEDGRLKDQHPQN